MIVQCTLYIADGAGSTFQFHPGIQSRSTLPQTGTTVEGEGPV